MTTLLVILAVNLVLAVVFGIVIGRQAGQRIAQEERLTDWRMRQIMLAARRLLHAASRARDLAPAMDGPRRANGNPRVRALG